MITPIEIEDKEFKKGLRGYKEEEVEDFLDIIKEDLEALYRENSDLKEKIKLYQDQISKYENIEETLKATLVRAESVAEDTCNSANKRAKLIVEESKLEARQQVEKANNKVIEVKKEYDSMIKEFKIFRNKFKSLLEDEIRNIDEIFYTEEMEHNEHCFETISMYSEPLELEEEENL